MTSGDMTQQNYPLHIPTKKIRFKLDIPIYKKCFPFLEMTQYVFLFISYSSLSPLLSLLLTLLLFLVISEDESIKAYSHTTRHIPPRTVGCK